MKTLALILAGGRGSRLDILSAHRAKPAVPFAGKFRLIDFVLSNCINSNIYNVGVLTQYLPHSLNKHIGIGKPWDLDRKKGGLTILQPFKGNLGADDWYQGTAHAVYKNISFIKNDDPENVIILSGDHVYEMDYDQMLDFHRQKGADLTIAAQPVDYQDAGRYGILAHQEDMKITEFVEKPADPPGNLASMGIYVFKTDVLLDMLRQNCTNQRSDFGHHIIPPMIDDQKQKVYVYKYYGYWRDVGTLDSYWETNLDLTADLPELNLYSEKWRFYTRSEEKPPAKFGKESRVSCSLISNGAIINGLVNHSIISPGVYIEQGAAVRDSVILNDTVIRSGTVIERAVIDKEVEIKENCQIGQGDDFSPNAEKPDLLQNGLNIIAKRAEIPAGTIMGRNCRVFSYVTEASFDANNIPSGSTITSELGKKITAGDEEKIEELNK
ncbi:glucose-1-phosphate adenylyltransferase [Halanaerobium saccharolyticum]|uniref:Glucose-1-phosphate adenylyltransferase n=1 Tax=Halanaerobium saccharolyticum TaxID=43595 RepID=A0A4R7YKC7_9FIRM|nr:glucose-1-phosphate adenylyltransferase [Halanaerobium saccharolyticum]RAK03956.1 glucose-1-phosphate adenylyltransferase [Halanaerobium saccharolyticum]TDV97308.1 glucose-1-phosphate adenylyltransferase [Halanaerobium saccharolyticum]TDX49042.1 glucose-1-phosphate adenylyltransferase [Halanaerobium saccharolyticum]